MEAGSRGRAADRPASAGAPPGRGGEPLEVGWLVDARMDEVDREAAEDAARDLEARLRAELPDFDWHVERRSRELLQNPVEEPAVLLEAGSLELATHHWDFALLVTASDLRGHYRPSALAVPSRALGVAVLSTFRIDPAWRRADDFQDGAARRATIRRRLLRLALHSLGCMAGLPRSDHAGSPMSSRTAPEDLDREDGFDDAEREALAEELARVADERIEEERGAERQGRLRFGLRALARNRGQILDGVRGGRWWEFPFRMGRLTTAAASALALLLVTEESWQVGTRAGPATLTGLTLVTVVATSLHVLHRQALLLMPHVPRRTEQAVVSRASAVLFVLLGVLVTWAVLFLSAFVLGRALFDPRLVARWTGAASAVGWTTYASQAGFVAGLAVLVGALGASFEGQSYVRHIAYVDDEL